MLSDEVIQSIESSTLCWLATVSASGTPNVSPKEAFTYSQEGKLLIANIASPGSVANIHANNAVCASFIDVFVQKGFKVKGVARVLEAQDDGYGPQRDKLVELIGDTFPIRSVIEVTPLTIEPIIAPSYQLFPGTTEKEMVCQSIKSYRVRDYL